MAERNILVVASDYEIIQQVRQALLGRGFIIHSAFSHSDAGYAFKQAQFDVALIDAAMQSRQSGEHTLPTLAKQKVRPPIIAVMLNNAAQNGELSDLQLSSTLTTLEENDIQRAVMEALRIPKFSSHQTRVLESESPESIELRQRIAQVEALFLLSRSLTEVLNLNEVLNRVVEAAQRLTDAEQGLILLPDDDDPSGDLWQAARIGGDEEDNKSDKPFRIRSNDMVPKTVFNEGRPLLIGAQGPQRVKTEFFVNSLLYVPILLKNKPIGVLGVMNKHKHDIFTERHQELLVSLASYAAIAIDNARNHEEIIKQAREMRALVESSNVINSSVALERTLPNICQQLGMALSLNRIEILKWDRQNNSLRTLARYLRNVRRTAEDGKIDLVKRPALRAALRVNELIWTARGSATVRGETEVMEEAGAGGMVVIPVRVGAQPLGMVQAFYAHAGQKRPQTDALTRAQRTGLQLLSEVANSENTRVIQHCLKMADEINKILGSDWCECALINLDSDSLSVHVAAGQGVWLSPPYPMLDLNKYRLFEEALNQHTPISIQYDETVVAGSGTADLLHHTRSRALLCMPLVNRGQAQGMVLLGDSERTRTFSSHEIDLARAIVGQAAMALENAQLVHDLEASLIELKETQGRLIQAAKMSAMGEMAAAVAHQINNPLTTIVLDTELMLLSEPQDSPNYEALSAIMRAGKRAAEVVRRLLAAARPTSADAPMQQVDVVAIVQDVVALVKTYIERSKVNLHLKVPDIPVPPVEAVPGELDDVWLNLLMNAHDALRGRKDAEISIEVRYTPGGSSIYVDVWDNGNGIPPEIIDDIFKPFFTTKPVGEGTGLGLHICRQVIEKVGGTITVKSAPEQGTRFLVQIPTKRGEP